MDGLKSKLFSGDAGSTAGEILMPNESLCPSLSFKQRVIGFVICVVLGFVMSIGGTIMLFFNDVTMFAVFYTIGNVLALASVYSVIPSTGFLIGPLRQIKSMFAETRMIASIIYLASMIATLIMAFVVEVPILVLVFVIVQFLAFAWYILKFDWCI